jgi:hypothetical protein
MVGDRQMNPFQDKVRVHGENSFQFYRFALIQEGKVEKDGQLIFADLAKSGC